jgi:hypothetical protein
LQIAEFRWLSDYFGPGCKISTPLVNALFVDRGYSEIAFWIALVISKFPTL